MSQTTAQKLRALKEHPHKYAFHDLLDILIEVFPEPKEITCINTDIPISVNVTFSYSDAHPGLKWEPAFPPIYTPGRVEPTILSVRRLSDGEVFKVGDLMDYDDMFYENDGCEIDEFVIQGDQIFVNHHFANKEKKDFNGNIDNWKKWVAPKLKPIFTTEDGVDMYELQGSVYSEDGWTCNVSSNGDYTKQKYFSTEKARDEYLLLHKPLITIDELLKLGDKYLFENQSFVIEDAIALAKSKLSNA